MAGLGAFGGCAWVRARAAGPEGRGREWQGIPTRPPPGGFRRTPARSAPGVAGPPARPCTGAQASDTSRRPTDAP
eukprot:14182369-Alexandrium_andersonii.AAC.1